MKKLSIVLAATLLALSFGAMTCGAEETPAAEAKKAGKKPSVKKERTTHITATVEAIDLETRVVTLKGPKGDLFDFTAGEQVKNLPQVKVGDLVDITYYESVAVKVYKPGEMPLKKSISHINSATGLECRRARRHSVDKASSK